MADITVEVSTLQTNIKVNDSIEEIVMNISSNTVYVEPTNKEVLDQITQEKLDSWDNVVTDFAEHTNGQTLSHVQIEESLSNLAESIDLKQDKLDFVETTKNKFLRDDNTFQTISIPEQIQSDWAQSDNLQPDFIKNKPENLSDFVNDMNFVDESHTHAGYSINPDNILLDKQYTEIEAAALAIGTMFQSENGDWLLKTSADTYYNFGAEISPLMKNGDRFTHLNGQAVYVSSGNGKLPVVKLAIASAELTSYSIAIATQDVLNTGNERGRYTSFGTVNEVAISNVIQTGESSALWVEGATLWLSAMESGHMTTIRPSAPNHAVRIGYITDKSGANVTIFAHIDTGHELTELHDVNLNSEVTTPADSDYSIIFNTNVFKKLTWANIKATLKTYFDNIYQAVGSYGDMFLASVQSVTGLKTFDKEKFAMKGTAAGKNILSTANTSANDYTHTLQAASGTIAHTSDIPSLAGYIMGSGIVNELAYFSATNSIVSSALLSFVSNVLKLIYNNLQTTTTTGLLLENTTAATSGIPSQKSPALTLKGRGFGSGADKYYEVFIDISPTITTDSANFTIQTAINGGAKTTILTSSMAGSIIANSTFSVSKSIAATSTDGIILSETTLTTVGTLVRYSPRTRYTAHVWNTNSSADNTVNFIEELIPVSSTAPTSYLSKSYANNSVVYNKIYALWGSGAIETLKGQYSYESETIAADTIGDFREGIIAGVWQKEYCSVGSATKGGGTWVVRERTLADGTKQIGDIVGGNYSEIQPDGSLFFYGTATMWDDLEAPTVNLQQTGAGISNNTSENRTEFLTTANLSDYMYTNLQIKHGWAGTTIFPHLHTEQTTGVCPNWLFQYRWQLRGQTKTTAWTNLICQSQLFTWVSGVLNQQINTVAGISVPANAGISDILQFRILRDNANTSGAFAGADGVAATASVTSFDIHIEFNSIGSRTIGTK